MLLDLMDREVIRLRCGECGREYDRVVIFAKSEVDAYAVVSAACHGHPDAAVWIDTTLGSWDESARDHVTMSCRVTGDGASAVDAPVAGRSDANYYGQLLTRAETLGHPRLPELRAVADAVVTTVPEVKAALDGADVTVRAATVERPFTVESEKPSERDEAGPPE